MDSTRIDHTLRSMTEAKDLPGVVAVAGSSNGTLYEGAFGKRDLAKDQP